MTTPAAQGERRMVELGVLGPTIARQGFHDPDGDFEKARQMIAWLRVRGMLTGAEAHSARRRLLKAIAKAERKE